MSRRRLDAELVRRGLAPSRDAARRLVVERQVLVDGATAEKPARLVDPAQALQVLAPPPPFVSRAGGKLAGALDRWAVDPTGWTVLDAGSSTGGFTDCLLQRGAARVLAVDVGTNQLHEKLRADDRVEVHERTDVRSFRPAEPVDAVVGDLSFISLGRVLDALVGAVRAGGPLVLLVKPQFEAGRQEVSRGKGIVTDPVTWRRVLGEVAERAASQGAGMMDAMASTVTGTQGNQEFVARFEAGADAPDDLSARLDAAVAEAVERSAG